ncbi:MAG: hypothetical protein R2825_02160 [Saprospiraceae bacterium]
MSPDVLFSFEGARVNIFFMQNNPKGKNIKKIRQPLFVTGEQLNYQKDKWAN